MQDIIDDVKKFACRGLGKNDTYLKSVSIFEKNMTVAKLRISVRMVKGRYLLGIIEEQTKKEYIPIIIDLKKGRLGKNMGFAADGKTVEALDQAIIRTIDDYTNHTEDNPTMDVYVIQSKNGKKR